MRVLFVHDRFGAFAGAEVNLQLTALELKRRRHDVAILHGPETGRSESAWRDLFETRFALKPDATEITAVSAIQHFQPDAIYVHKMADLNVLATLVASEIPVVRMVHDHDLYCMRSYKYFPLSRNICTRGAGWHCVFPCGAVLSRKREGFPIKWLSFAAKRKELHLNRRFHRMIVATDFMRQELLQNGFDPNRIEVHAPVPNTTGNFPQSSFSDRNLILYAGQVIRGKGVDVLLESLAKVQTKFECLIIGDGTHRAYCEALSKKLGLADRVKFKGYLAPEILKRFYSEASVAAVSSVWPEPFGAVGLEAMRFGVPVVGFDAGGIREWLINGENGILVPWMDRAAYAGAVEQLLRDKTFAQKLGAQGQRFACERFGFEQYINGLEGMFARVVGQAQTAVA